MLQIIEIWNNSAEINESRQERKPEFDGSGRKDCVGSEATQ
jgi:hypothetical protein